MGIWQSNLTISAENTIKKRFRIAAEPISLQLYSVSTIFLCPSDVIFKRLQKSSDILNTVILNLDLAEIVHSSHVCCTIKLICYLTNIWIAYEGHKILTFCMSPCSCMEITAYKDETIISGGKNFVNCKNPFKSDFKQRYIHFENFVLRINEMNI